ncbi:helix-turn-helix transcriptional regulator [Spirillospora sp. NBC_00431]
MTKNEVRQELVRQRRRRGLSRSQVAEQLRVSANTVRRWERGKHDPRQENIIEISRLFQAPIEEVERWFLLASMPGGDWTPENDTQCIAAETFAHTEAAIHKAYREALERAGLTNEMISGVQASVDLYIKGFTERQRQG